MAWDEYIPYKGDKRTAKRIRELEHKAGTWMNMVKRRMRSS